MASDDLHAARELEQIPLSLPAGLDIEWLGVSGYRLTYEGVSLFVDPYFSRVPLRALLLRRRALPDPALVARYGQAPGEVAGVLVGHTHFDHALDVPAIARLTGAKVFGSKSAATLCAVDGVPRAQIVDVESQLANGTFTAEVGPFELRFYPSAHSKLLLGRRVPMAGEIVDCDQVPHRMSGYKCGAVFACELRAAGKSIFHLGSAELVDASVPKHAVDLLLFCAAGWTQTPRIIERAASRLSPETVLLSHWDDFFRPIDRPVRALPAVGVPRLIDNFRRELRDANIGVIPPLGEIRI